MFRIQIDVIFSKLRIYSKENYEGTPNIGLLI